MKLFAILARAVLALVGDIVTERLPAASYLWLHYVHSTVGKSVLLKIMADHINNLQYHVIVYFHFNVLICSMIIFLPSMGVTTRTRFVTLCDYLHELSFNIE